jgi:ribosome-binding ATPase YchF (GTP1/OBG family)
VLNTADISHAKDILNENPMLSPEFNLLCIKPVIYVANLNDDVQSSKIFDEFHSKASSNKIVKIYGKIENELADFAKDERQEYKKELGIDKDGLEKFILECYSMLNLMTFYTANENEARAWPLKAGSRIIEAAGKIHSDMARGFIKAEIVNCRDIIKAGSMHHAREEGKVKLEGKEYIVADGDLILIRFAV